MLYAVVIPFPKPASSQMTLQPPPVARGPAEIVIFPGVRYDRIPETEDLFAIATAPLKAPSKRK
ncbi:hypothetical protein G5V57_25595 [Nordella sp. HKS 07]|uniref:hypothetical protein n=1 Tax=Nordella sp. HKS 07 TaxID=2712222 RepID=UPI0013E101D9|nr:hypothetical protein [Nordella sp. HKS 07]QIG50810.1 hypothetical protein G5V57_25595 [Nordella sp. HKS 07]